MTRDARVVGRIGLRVGARATGVLLLTAALFVGVTSAVAEESFNKPITIIVPHPPGGPTDVFARLLAETMRPLTGFPIIVDNKSGAAGMIAARTVMRAPPDGTVLYFTTAATLVTPPLMQTTPEFDPLKDFASVALTVVGGGVVVAAKSFPPSTAADVIAYAKANPGKIAFGSSGVGSVNHLYMEVFQDVTDTSMLHVPYRGAAPALTAILAGDVQLFTVDLGSVIEHIKGGNLKAIGQTSDRRSPLLPDVPILGQTISPRLSAPYWAGVVAPRGTPPAVIDSLNRTINKAISSSAFMDRAKASNFDVEAGPPGALHSRIAAEAELWRPTIKSKNITIQ